MKRGEKQSTGITCRDLLRKIGKSGIYVPPTLAALTAAPRAFARSPGDVTISGTFSLTTTSYHYGFGVFAAPPIRIWCGPDGSTFHVALAGLDPTQDWHIQVWLSPVSDCMTGSWDVLWTLLASGPDANRGTVADKFWNVLGGAVVPGEALQVDFSVIT